MPTRVEIESLCDRINRAVQSILPGARVVGGDLGAKTLAIRIEAPRPWPIDALALARREPDPLIVPLGLDLEDSAAVYVNLNRYPLFVIVSSHQDNAERLARMMIDALRVKGVAVGDMSCAKADVLVGAYETYVVRRPNKPSIVWASGCDVPAPNAVKAIYTGEDEWVIVSPEGIHHIAAATVSPSAAIQTATVGKDVWQRYQDRS